MIVDAVVDFHSCQEARTWLLTLAATLASRSFGSWRAHYRFGQTATELAFHRDRVQGGITSADTASREAAYVRLLRELESGPGAR